MEHLYLAALGSALIGATTYAVWRHTRELGFVIGAAALYYWSVFGAFVFISDTLRHVESPKYEWVLITSFPVALDDDYFRTIAYYCVFVLCVLIGVLVFAKRDDHRNVAARESQQVLTLSPLRILVTAVVSIGAAFLLVRNDLVSAALQDVSVYAATRAGEENQAYSFRMVAHQTLTQIAIATIALGWAVHFSRARPRFLAARSTLVSFTGYVVATMTMAGFCLVLGRKNELLYGVLFGAVLYLGNDRRPRYGVVAVGSGLGLLVLGVIDAIRGFSIGELLLGNEISFKETLLRGFSALSSNESVSSHFSLYGAIHWHVSLTYGTSVVSLLASAIPRVIWPGRPGDIYVHYAGALGLPPDVGYAIHHATGWYLNFGLIGIIVGALTLAGVWTSLWNARQRAVTRRSILGRSFGAVAFAGFTASIPMMIRAGIESYKGVVVIGVLFPTLLTWAVTLRRPARITVRRAAASHSFEVLS